MRKGYILFTYKYLINSKLNYIIKEQVASSHIDLVIFVKRISDIINFLNIIIVIKNENNNKH